MLKLCARHHTIESKTTEKMPKLCARHHTIESELCLMRSIIARACCFVFICSCSITDALRSADFTRAAASFPNFSRSCITARINALCSLVSSDSTICCSVFIPKLSAAAMQDRIAAMSCQPANRSNQFISGIINEICIIRSRLLQNNNQDSK